jgi:hypothetical protein
LIRELLRHAVGLARLNSSDLRFVPLLIEELLDMTVQAAAGIRTIESEDDFEESRIEAIGYIFHGHLLDPDGKKTAVKAGTNVLHFARCAKLEKVGGNEKKIWFRTIRIAKVHLDQVVGEERWKWCKICEREITQRNINEA